MMLKYHTAGPFFMKYSAKIQCYNDSEKDVLELRHFAEDELGLDHGRIELLKYNELMIAIQFLDCHLN